MTLECVSCKFTNGKSNCLKLFPFIVHYTFFLRGLLNCLLNLNYEIHTSTFSSLFFAYIQFQIFVQHLTKPVLLPTRITHDFPVQFCLSPTILLNFPESSLALFSLIHLCNTLLGQGFVCLLYKYKALNKCLIELLEEVDRLISMADPV